MNGYFQGEVSGSPGTGLHMDGTLPLAIRLQCTRDDLARGTKIHVWEDSAFLELAVKVTNQAHVGPDSVELGHRDGFCKACAEILVAFNRAVLAFDDPEPQPTDGPDYHTDHQAWKERRARD